MAHVGNAYVHVRPEVKGFFKKLRNDLKDEEKRDGKPTKVSVTPEFDRDKFAAKLDKAIEDYNERGASKAPKIKVTPEVDKRQLTRSLDDAFSELDRDVYVDVDVRGMAKLDALQSRLAALPRDRDVTVNVRENRIGKDNDLRDQVVDVQAKPNVELGLFESNYGKLEKWLASRPLNVRIRPNFDTDAQADILEQLESFREGLDTRIRVAIDADSKRALYAELDGLSTDRQKTIRVKTSGIAKALADIKLLDAALDRLGGKASVRVAPEVDVPDVPDAPERREMPANFEGRMKVYPELSTDSFVKDYESFLTGLNREVEVKVRAVPDTSALDADLARARTAPKPAPEKKAKPTPEKKAKPDVADAVSDVRVNLDTAAAEARLDALTRDRTVNVKVNVDGDQMQGIVDAAAKKAAKSVADGDGLAEPAAKKRAEADAVPTAQTSGKVLSTNKGHTIIPAEDVDRVMNPKLHWEGITSDWLQQVKHSPIEAPQQDKGIDFRAWAARAEETERRQKQLYDAMRASDEARAKADAAQARLDHVIDSRPQGKRRQAQRRREIDQLRDRATVRGRQASRAESAYTSEAEDWKTHVKDIRNQMAPLVETARQMRQSVIRSERAQAERDGRARRLQELIRDGKVNDKDIQRERAAINDAHKRMVKANKEIADLHGQYRDAVRRDRELGSPVGLPEDHRRIRSVGAAPEAGDIEWGASTPISQRPDVDRDSSGGRDRDRTVSTPTSPGVLDALDVDIPRRAGRNARAVDGLNDSLSRLGHKGARSATEGLGDFAKKVATAPLRGMFSIEGAIRSIGTSFSSVGTNALKAGKAASTSMTSMGGGAKGGGKGGWAAVAQAVSSLAAAFFKLKIALGAVGSLAGAAFDGIAGGAAILSSLLRPAVHASKLILGLPTLLGAAAAAAGTTMLAFNGLGAALSSLGDDAAFEQAVANLTPSAEAFARSVKAIVPEVEKLRDATQERFFDGMAESFGDFANRVMPVFHQEIPRMAEALGNLADSAMSAFSSAEGIQMWERGLEAMSEGFRRMQPGVEDFFSGLHRMVAIGAEELLPALGDAVTDLGARFNSWASEGNLTRIFDQAKRGLQDFGQMVGSAWTGLSGFFSAMADGADRSFSQFGGAVEWAKSKLGDFADWAQSDLGQAQISSFFDDASASAQNLAGILGGFGASFVNDFMPGFRETLEEHGGAIERLGEKFIQFGEDATETFGESASWVDGALDWIGDFVDGFERVMNHDWDGLQDVIDNRGLREVANAAQDAGLAIQAIPDQKTIHVEALADHARTAIEEFGGQVRDLPDGNVEITFDSVAEAQGAAHRLREHIEDMPEGEIRVQYEQALAAIEAMHRLDGTEYEPISIDVEANTEVAFAKLREVTDAAVAYDGTTQTLQVEAFTEGAAEKLRALDFDVQSLDDGSFAVNMTNEADIDAAIADVANQIRDLPEGEARINAEMALATLVALKGAIADGAPADIPTELQSPEGAPEVDIDPISIESEIEPPAEPDLPDLPPVDVPVTADTSQFSSGVSGLSVPDVSVNVTAETGQFASAVGALSAPPVTVTVTTPNIGGVQAQLSALGNAISAVLTVTSNVAEVQAEADRLNDPLAATHTITSNVATVRGEVLALNGLNTSSTHTVNIRRNGSLPGNAAGGFVGAPTGVNWSGLPGFASGGLVGFDKLPRFAAGGLVGAAGGAAGAAALALARRLALAAARQARQQITDMARSGLSNMTRQGMAGITGGGLLFGPGSGTSDDILGLDASGIPTARVSNGEFVTKEENVNRDTLPYLTAINNGWVPPSEEELERQQEIEEARANRYETFHAGFIAEDIANFYMDDIGSLTGLKLNLETMKETPWYRLAFGNEEARNAAVADIRRQKEEEERERAAAEREAAKQQEREEAKMQDVGNPEDIMDTAGNETEKRTEMAQVREVQTREDGGTRNVTVNQNVGAINTYSETAAVRRYRRATEGAVTHALSI